MQSELNFVNLMSVIPIHSDDTGNLRVSLKADPSLSMGFSHLVTQPGLSVPTELFAMFCLASPSLMKGQQAVQCTVGFGNAFQWSKFGDPFNDECFMNPSVLEYAKVLVLDSPFRLYRHRVEQRVWAPNLSSCVYGNGKLHVYANGFCPNVFLGVLVISYRILWAPKTSGVMPLYKVAGEILKGIQNVTVSVSQHDFTQNHANLVANVVVPAVTQPVFWQLCDRELASLTEMAKQYGTLSLRELDGGSNNNNSDDDLLEAWETSPWIEEEEQEDYPLDNFLEPEIDFDGPTSVTFTGQTMDIHTLVERMYHFPNEESDSNDDEDTFDMFGSMDGLMSVDDAQDDQGDGHSSGGGDN